MHFSLTDEQTAIQDMALNFAKERIAPGASEWDETGHFPVDVIRETAGLGMATIYVPAEQGGSGLSRLDGALIFEALVLRLPGDRVLHLDPQHGGLDGGEVRHRRAGQGVDAEARHDGVAVVLLPDGARCRVGRGGAQGLGAQGRRSLRPRRNEAVHLRRRAPRTSISSSPGRAATGLAASRPSSS